MSNSREAFPKGSAAVCRRAPHFTRSQLFGSSFVGSSRQGCRNDALTVQFRVRPFSIGTSELFPTWAAAVVNGTCPPVHRKPHGVAVNCSFIEGSRERKTTEDNNANEEAGTRGFPKGGVEVDSAPSAALVTRKLSSHWMCVYRQRRVPGGISRDAPAKPALGLPSPSRDGRS